MLRVTLPFDVIGLTLSEVRHGISMLLLESAPLYWRQPSWKPLQRILALEFSGRIGQSPLTSSPGDMLPDFSQSLLDLEIFINVLYGVQD